MQLIIFNKTCSCDTTFFTVLVDKQDIANGDLINGNNGYKNITWPVKRVAEIPDGDIVIGGLHMVHEREDKQICGPVMPQGGLQVITQKYP